MASRRRALALLCVLSSSTSNALVALRCRQPSFAASSRSAQPLLLAKKSKRKGASSGGGGSGGGGAQASQPGFITLQVPDNAAPGTTVQFSDPNSGQAFQVAVPPGAEPGGTFQVQLAPPPAASAAAPPPTPAPPPSPPPATFDVPFPLLVPETEGPAPAAAADEPPDAPSDGGGFLSGMISDEPKLKLPSFDSYSRGRAWPPLAPAHPPLARPCLDARPASRRAQRPSLRLPPPLGCSAPTRASCRRSTRAPSTRRNRRRRSLFSRSSCSESHTCAHAPPCLASG